MSGGSLRLTEDQITTGLARVPAWTRVSQAIRREFAFADFVAAIAFVNAVAGAAERADHHPDIDVRYDRVTLTLATHDAGGLTRRDFDLAATADGLAQG